MALFVVLALSALSALGSTLGSGAFGTLAWLWVLPLSFVGSFLGLLLLMGLVVVIMALTVPMHKPQAKDDPVFRWVIHFAVSLLIPLLGIRLHTKGLENTPENGRVFLVSNHISDIDPAVLLHCFPKNKFAFISKKENEKKPIIGQFLHRIMCQSVNRENDREALKTILNCIRLIKEDEVSIGVFPEGRIYPDRKLHTFRSGVFKIPQKTNVPIMVCTLQNTCKVIPNFLRLKPTDVHVHLLAVLQPEDFKNLSTVDLGSRIYEMMAQDLGPDLVSQEDAG